MVIFELTISFDIRKAFKVIIPNNNAERITHEIFKQISSLFLNNNTNSINTLRNRQIINKISISYCRDQRSVIRILICNFYKKQLRL